MNDGCCQSNSMIFFLFFFCGMAKITYGGKKKISRMNPKKSHSKVLLPIIS